MTLTFIGGRISGSIISKEKPLPYLSKGERAKDCKVNERFILEREDECMQKIPLLGRG
jgi:hypothetical protein